MAEREDGTAAENPVTKKKEELSFEELHAIRDSRTRELSQIKAACEEPSDKVYSYRLTIGTQERVLRYHRWTHDQVNLLRQQAFNTKLQRGEKLTEEEEAKFAAVKIEMCLDAIVDKSLWADILNESNLEVVQAVYNLIAASSMCSNFFLDKLKDFYSTEEGRAYGEFWFLIQRRLPHEIGALPDSSVLAANTFINLYAEKVNQKTK